jgi:hypothetical protein
MASTLRFLRDKAAGLTGGLPTQGFREVSHARIDDLGAMRCAAEPNIEEESRVWLQRPISEVAALKYLLGRKARNPRLQENVLRVIFAGMPDWSETLRACCRRRP